MKRVPQLRDLSDDHHTALVLARRSRDAAREGRAVEAAWRRVREAFRDDLDPHFAIEERHLLPALEEIGEHDLARGIRRDHAALRALRDDPACDADGLERFARCLEEHVRFEERRVFGPTQDRLPAGALADIQAACSARRGAGEAPGSDGSAG